MDAGQLRLLIVRPTLQALQLWSEEAEDLLMGTAAQESGLRLIHQLGAGPALGLWQDEPEDHDDLWANWMPGHPDLAARLIAWCHVARPVGDFRPDSINLLFNLRYGVAICRLHYERAPGALPQDLPGQAEYYKTHYNTAGGAATVDEYLANYRRLIGAASLRD